jgi:transketolase
MFYDANNIQLSHTTDVTSSEDTAKKYEAWNWHVQTIEGNNITEIRAAIQSAIDESGKPSLIIGKTIMGKGAKAGDGTSYEKKVSTHGQPLSAAGGDLENTYKNLGADPSNPFQVFSEVQDFFKDVLKNKVDYATSCKKEEKEWAASNQALAEKWEKFFAMDYSNLDFTQVNLKENGPTRGASSAVLSYMADNVENLIVASADLANSDKTDGFLKKTKPLAKNDFSGAFFVSSSKVVTDIKRLEGVYGLYFLIGILCPPYPIDSKNSIPFEPSVNLTTANFLVGRKPSNLPKRFFLP